MKLFQRNKHNWEDCILDNYQFLIVRNRSLLHVIYEDDNPCSYTGIRVVAEFLSPSCLFGIDFQIKGYSLGFYFITEYWND